MGITAFGFLHQKRTHTLSLSWQDEWSECALPRSLIANRVEETGWRKSAKQSWQIIQIEICGTTTFKLKLTDKWASRRAANASGPAAQHYWLTALLTGLQRHTTPGMMILHNLIKNQKNLLTTSPFLLVKSGLDSTSMLRTTNVTFKCANDSLQITKIFITKTRFLPKL